MLENDNEELIEDEILVGDSDDILIDGDISDPVLTNEEETLFIDSDSNDSDLVMDESPNFVYPEEIDLSNDEAIVPQNNLAADLQGFTDSLTGTEHSEGDQDTETETSSEVMDSLSIIQQNVKTGFDNLSLIGTVNVGLMSFSIGVLIIYCYIGRFR